MALWHYGSPGGEFTCTTSDRKLDLTIDNPGHHLLIKDTIVTNVFQGEMSSIMLMNNVNMFLDPGLPFFVGINSKFDQVGGSRGRIYIVWWRVA